MELKDRYLMDKSLYFKLWDMREGEYLYIDSTDWSMRKKFGIPKHATSSVGMEMRFISAWEKKKEKLREYFKSTNMSEYHSYGDILKKLLALVISDDGEKYNYEDVIEIDNGYYEGSLIFIIPDQYKSVGTLISTHVQYGSSSAIDALCQISNGENEPPSDNQLKSYMLIALHLVQKMKYATK